MSVILKKELKAYFTSLFTYIFFVAFTLVTGIFYATKCLDTGNTQFGTCVLDKSFLVVLVFVPLCTMRILSQEKREKTEQLLFTAPVSTCSVLMGKVLATFFVVLLPLVISLFYVIAMIGYGSVDGWNLFAAYLACFLMTVLLVSIGVFVSSITANSIFAAVLSYVIYAIIILIRVVETSDISADVYHCIYACSIYDKWVNMMYGLVIGKDVVFLIGLACFFFSLTWLSLIIKREGMKKTVSKWAIIVCLIFVCNLIATATSKTYDCTIGRMVTLSNETKQFVKDLNEPVQIYYLGGISHASIVYQEFLQQYSRLNENIEVCYQEVDTDGEFYKQYLQNIGVIEEGSMLVVTEERFIYIDASSYVQSVYTSTYTYKDILQIENQLTGAIHYVTSDDSSQILALTGSGEKELPRSFAGQLQMNNYDFKSVNVEKEASAIQNVFLDDAKMAFICSPQVDYSKEAIEELDWFLEHGGNVFVSIDALNDDMPNLYAFLENYGIKVEPGVVIEKDSSLYAEDTPYYILPLLNENEFTKGIRSQNRRVLTMTSKGLTSVDSAKGYETTQVLKTSVDSFSKVSDFENITVKGEGDLLGSFAVATVARKEGKGSLFVLSSDLFFEDEVDLMVEGGNRRFFLDVVDILTGHENGIIIEGKDIGNQTAFFTEKVKKVAKVIVIGIVPLLVLICGITIFGVRYRGVFVKNKCLKENQDAEKAE